MALDRKTGETKEIQTNAEPPIIPSKKQMKENMMPKVGDMVGPCKVTYVNYGKFRFSAEGTPLPSVGAQYESEGRIYEIERVDPSKNRFNAIFRGFKQNPIVEAPEEIHEDLAKVIE